MNENEVRYKVESTFVDDTYHYLVTELRFYRTSSKEKINDEEVIVKAKQEENELQRN